MLLWAAFLRLSGCAGCSIRPAILKPSASPSPALRSTRRADLSAFFIASAQLPSALVPAGRALLVPAALFGTALAGRLIGAAMGDPTNWGIIQGMIIEALTVVLMLASWWALARFRSRRGPLTTCSDDSPTGAARIGRRCCVFRDFRVIAPRPLFSFFGWRAYGNR